MTDTIESPAGYELIKDLGEVHVKRTTKNPWPQSIYVPCAKIANRDGETEHFDVADENGVVL